MAKARANTGIRNILSIAMASTQPITISKKMERQLNKKQKIVTESGIEIIVPIEFLQNNDVFEYIQDETGKVSIIIKDVGSILK